MLGLDMGRYSFIVAYSQAQGGAARRRRETDTIGKALMRTLIPVIALAALAHAADSQFDNEVCPIFQARCTVCHGATRQGKLDLRIAESALKGGATGPAIVAGASARSLLLDKVVTGQMPPGKTKLTEKEIDAIRQWIDHGVAPPAAVAETPKERDVLAVLQVRCMICHGSLKQQGGLDLRTMASRLKGGKSGPALVPGKPEES